MGQGERGGANAPQEVAGHSGDEAVGGREWDLVGSFSRGQGSSIKIKTGA